MAVPETRKVPGRRTRSLGLVAAAASAAVVVAACGTSVKSGGSSSGASTVVAPAIDGSGAGAEAATPAPISTIASPATVDTPAQRRDPVRIAWIAGSDSVWQDVDLPAAVGDRLAPPDGTSIEIESMVRIAAMPEDVMASVAAAAATGVDGLVVPLNVAWLTWEAPACDDIDDAHARYPCVLTESSPDVTARRAEALAALVDAIVATGLPALLYAMPHSTDALTDPVIGPLVDAAEQTLASFDPGVPSTTFVASSFTRDGGPYLEGPDFIDMVHPTASGAERLAEILAPVVAEALASTGVTIAS